MISAFVVSSCLLMLDPVSVMRWSNDSPTVGEIVSVGLQGIELRTDGAVLPEFIAWYELRAIDPPQPNTSPYQQTAMASWRAHARRMRGDFLGAIPLYETLRDEYLWQHGDQSKEISIGLGVCLIDADRRMEAVLPMLSWFVAAMSHTPGVELREPLIDDQTLLPVRLPPVFLTGQQAEIGDLPDSPLLTERERLLYAYYAMVAGGDVVSQSTVDEIEQLKRSLRGRDPGTILIEQMAFAQAHPDTSKRRAAQDALRRRTRTQSDSWIEAWARLGLGAALLRDQDRNVQERGIIELIHVVTRLHSIDPGLTMLAAEMASSHLHSTSRAEWGQRVLHDAKANLTNRTAAARAIPQEAQTDD